MKLQKSSLRLILSVSIFIVLFSADLNAHESEQKVTLAEKLSMDSPDKVIHELYRLVSWEAGALPEWDQLKNLFLEEALIILRSREGFHMIDRKGFIDLWLEDINKYHLDKTGFKEEIVELYCEQVGNIACCMAVYMASIPGRKLPPQAGFDSYQLIKKDNRWWITAIVNEVFRPGEETQMVNKIMEMKKLDEK
jgi:hypothetical protein